MTAEGPANEEVGWDLPPLPSPVSAGVTDDVESKEERAGRTEVWLKADTPSVIGRGWELEGRRGIGERGLALMVRLRLLLLLL